MTILELLFALGVLLVACTLPLAIIAGLVWAVIRRIEQKKTEKFEQREN